MRYCRAQPLAYDNITNERIITMIKLNSGLQDSLVILEILRNSYDLRNIGIYVGTFMNCREMGLTFTVYDKTDKPFTWCVYESRGGDNIVINGRKDFFHISDTLPYCDNYRNLAEFDFGEYHEAAAKLTDMILKYYNDSIV